MVKALLLFHPQQLFGLVTWSPVGHHHSRVAGGDQFSYFFISMLPADLKYRRLVGVESHQMHAFPVNPPTGVISIDNRRLGYASRIVQYKMILKTDQKRQ